MQDLKTKYIKPIDQDTEKTINNIFDDLDTLDNPGLCDCAISYTDDCNPETTRFFILGSFVKERVVTGHFVVELDPNTEDESWRAAIKKDLDYILEDPSNYLKPDELFKYIPLIEQTFPGEKICTEVHYPWEGRVFHPPVAH